MRELPEAIWQVADTVYTELPYACEETGDLAQPLQSGALKEHQVRYMADHLQDMKAGNDWALGKTRFYKSVGMSLFDLIVATNI